MDVGADAGQDLTIVVPAYNEGENLQATVTEILDAFAENGLSPCILVVDDGSADDTRTVLHAMKDVLGDRLAFVSHDANLGLGAAIKTGFLHARTPWVGWLPADGQFAPADLQELYDARERGVAIIGRVEVARRKAADNIARVILSLGLRVVMRALHPNIPDFNGIMVVRRDAVDFSRLVCRTGFVNMEILDRMRRASIANRFEERIVTVRPRRAGVSKVANSRTVLVVVDDLVKLRIDYWRRAGA